MHAHVEFVDATVGWVVCLFDDGCSCIYDSSAVTEAGGCFLRLLCSVNPRLFDAAIITSFHLTDLRLAHRASLEGDKKMSGCLRYGGLLGQFIASLSILGRQKLHRRGWVQIRTSMNIPVLCLSRMICSLGSYIRTC